MGLDVVQHGFMESVKDIVSQFFGACSASRNVTDLRAEKQEEEGELPNEAYVPNAAEMVSSAAEVNGIAGIIDTMKLHPENEDIQMEGCRALMETTPTEKPFELMRMRNEHESVSKKGRDGQAEQQNQEPSEGAVEWEAIMQIYVKIVGMGAVDVVMDASADYPDNETIQESMCKLLWYLTRNEENIAPVSKLHSINRITAAMEKFPENRHLLRASCAALKNLASKPTNKILIFNNGGVKLLVGCMEQHCADEDAELQASACAALTNVCSMNKANQATIVAHRGIPVIINSMKCYYGDQYLQKYACRLLNNLASHNDENKMRIRGSGGVEAIVRAMIAHPGDADVQCYSCEALKLLAHDGKGQLAIAQAGAIKSIVEAMLSFPDYGDLQVEGCNSLINISSSVEANREIIGNEGGGEAVVRAMKNHPTRADAQVCDRALTSLPNSNEQEHGCWALSNIANGNTNNKLLITAAGGVPVVVEAMKSFPDNGKVQLQACRALNQISVGSAANQTCIATEGGVQTIVQAMQKHKKEPEVLVAACCALSNISVLKNNQPIVEGHKGIAAVVQGMTANLDNVDVQIQACWVLKNVSANHHVNQAMVKHAQSEVMQVQGLWTIKTITPKDPEVRAAVMSAGGIDAAVRAMTSFAASADVQLYGCWAVKNLAAQPGSQGQIIDQGGMKVVLQCMRAHLQNSQVQIHGSGALLNLALSEEHREVIAANGGVEAVVTAMTSHPSEVQVQLWGCWAIHNFCTKQNSKVVMEEKGAASAVGKAMSSFPADAELIEHALKALWFVDRSMKAQMQTIKLKEVVAAAKARHATKPNIVQAAKRVLAVL